MHELAAIYSDRIDITWPLAEPLISKAVERSSGRHSSETIKAALKDRAMQLWLALDGMEPKAVVVTELVTYATGLKACSFVIVVGEDRDEWVHMIEGIKFWARQNECEIIEAWARPGWQRVMGWRESHRLIEERL